MKATVKRGSGRIGDSDYDVVIQSTGRKIAGTDRSCDAQRISKSLDDTELKLLRRFYNSYKAYDEAIKSADDKFTWDQYSKNMSLADYKIQIWRAKEVNKK